MRASLLVLLGLAACQEFNLSSIPDYNGAAESPDLSTPSKTDLVVQRTQPMVDVLWVIDNSGSMSQEQEKVAVNFDAFTQFFMNSGLDWHIGAITTDCGTLDDGSGQSTGLDPDCGKLISVAGYPFVSEEAPRADLLFSQLVRAGAGGSGDEMGLLATWRALVPITPSVQQANRGFLRKNAGLHIIVVSDEPDSSPSSEFSMSEFVDYVKYQLKPVGPGGEGPAVTFSSIVGPKARGCVSSDGSGDAAAGIQYIDATNQIGGIFASICTTDWYPVLEALGLQAAGLRQEYFLSEIPVDGTLKVWVRTADERRDGVDEASLEEGETAEGVCEARGLTKCFTYSYDPVRNSILMIDFLPPATAQVRLNYDLLSGLSSLDEVADTDVP